MKKKILCGALFNLICAPVQSLPAADTSSVAIPIGNKPPLQTEFSKKQLNNPVQQAHPSALQQPPQVLQNTQIIQQVTPEPQKQVNIINCGYKIPVETTKINQTLVLSWAEQAVTQSFNFNAESMEAQLQALQACYTEGGWDKFRTALYSSGNIEVIKAQQLTVSSQIDGPAQLIESNDYLWKMTLPLRVVYQNDNERVTHFLNIYLTIGRKITGDLGIMQMIATPRFAPLSLKFKSVEEAAQNIYLTVVQKSTDALNTVQKLTIPFFSSLFQKATRAASLHIDSISSRAEGLTQKIPQNTTRKVQQLARLQPHQLSQKAQTTHQLPITQHQPIPNYKTPTETTKMVRTLVLNWLKPPVTVDFKREELDTPTKKLQSWHPETGLVAFNTAGQTSDNIEANKTQKLTVDTQLDRHSQFIETNNNRWRITLPLKVAYQNDKNKVTQLLNINFTVGWKIADLGIMQMIATPRVDSVLPKTTAATSPNVGIISEQAKQQIDSTQKIQPHHPPLQTQTLALQNPTQDPKNTQTTQYIPSKPQKQPDIINCEYKIPAETTKIDQAFILSWAAQAATQSFSFNTESIDTQLQKLQACYTEKGWIDFMNALYKSGNIEAIKTLKVNMSSEMSGQAQLLESKDNQWKITLPLKVVYQNDKEQVTQLVNINLTIGRKITGDLGIMQIVATLGVASIP